MINYIRKMLGISRLETKLEIVITAFKDQIGLMVNEVRKLDLDYSRKFQDLYRKYEGEESINFRKQNLEHQQKALTLGNKIDSGQLTVQDLGAGTWLSDIQSLERQLNRPESTREEVLGRVGIMFRRAGQIMENQDSKISGLKDDLEKLTKKYSELVRNKDVRA